MEEGQRPVGQPVVDFCAHSLNPCCNGRGSKTVIRVKSVTPVRVLILVVMEEGQRQLYLIAKGIAKYYVLILVVMEEGQRPFGLRVRGRNQRVLILVVMEEGQRRMEKVGCRKVQPRS